MVMKRSILPTVLLLWSSASAGRLAGRPGEAPGALSLRVVEVTRGGEKTPVPCRVHLRDSRGKSVRAPGLPFFHDHFSCEGSVRLDLRPGEFRYTIARGPEYREVSGKLRIESGETARREITLERWIDLAARGWWSGETHVHRPLEHIPLLLRSEDLHVAPVLTQWNQRSIWRDRPLPEKLVRKAGPGRLYHVLGCEDERRGGALFFLNLHHPLHLEGDQPEYPSPVTHLKKALEQPDVRVEVEKPFWWDMPTWVATGKVDSIGIANNHMCRDRMLENEAWGRPRDTKRLPPPRGNGYHSQEIYYRLLNCGFRIPPTAGSASGVLPNPVGYNRVYVHLEGELSYDAWWKGLAAGRSFVTNGPVLLVEANGRLPGEVFRSEKRNGLKISLDVRVDGPEPLETVEIIRDGAVAQRLVRDELRGWLRPEPLVFEQSGWFLVRAIARIDHTFRFASTAPFHVEIGPGKRRVHRDDVQYFLRWIDERIENLRKGGQPADPDRLESVIEPHREARRVFERLLRDAT